MRNFAELHTLGGARHTVYGSHAYRCAFACFYVGSAYAGRLTVRKASRQYLPLLGLIRSMYIRHTETKRTEVYGCLYASAAIDYHRTLWRSR